MASFTLFSHVLLAGVVGDAEGMKRALRDIRPHQVQRCSQEQYKQDTGTKRAQRKIDQEQDHFCPA